MRFLTALILAFVFPSGLAASDIHICHAINPNTQPQAALAACSAYLDLNPDDPAAKAEALGTRGVAYRELGDLFQSAKDLRASLKLRKTPDTQRMLAWTYREMHKPSEAEAIYTEILTEDDHWQGWLSRCVVRIDQQKYESALGDCEQALLRDPSNTDALFFTAQAHNFLGNGARALPLAQHAVDLAPDISYFRAELAWAYYLSGDPQKARKTAEDALKTFPQDSDLLHFLDQLQ